PAMRDGKPVASKRVIGPMPERPARIASHAVATPMPTGETMPRPVTTTRRRFMRMSAEGRGRRVTRALAVWRARRRPATGRVLLLDVRADVVDRLLHGGDLLGLLIRYLGLEFLLERHHELHRIERVRAEIVDKRGFVLDLRLVHAELLGNDLLDSLFD